MSSKSIAKVDLGSRFDPFHRIDREGPALVRYSALAQAITKYASPELIEKVKNHKLIGARQAKEFLHAAHIAVFRIKTRYDYIRTPMVETVGRRFLPNIAVTPLPFAPTNHGSWYLCVQVKENLGGNRCTLAFPILTIGGESRTIVVTKHACEQLSERAGIIGNHVAFLAEAILKGKCTVAKDRREGWHVLACDLQGETIGCCPVERVECEMKSMGHGKRFGAHLFAHQPRWRLKTFYGREFAERMSLIRSTQQGTRILKPDYS